MAILLQSINASKQHTIHLKFTKCNIIFTKLKNINTNSNDNVYIDWTANMTGTVLNTLYIISYNFHFSIMIGDIHKNEKYQMIFSFLSVCK